MDIDFNTPIVATVTLASSTNNLAASHVFEQRNIKLISPKGYYYIPNINDELLLSCVKKPFALGYVNNFSADISPGEILIKNDSGAYIKLLSNGDIEINKLLITQNGEIKHQKNNYC